MILLQSGVYTVTNFQVRLCFHHMRYKRLRSIHGCGKVGGIVEVYLVGTRFWAFIGLLFIAYELAILLMLYNIVWKREKKQSKKQLNTLTNDLLLTRTLGRQGEKRDKKCKF